MTIADCQAHQQLLTAAGAVPPSSSSSPSAATRQGHRGILGNLAIQNAPASARSSRRTRSAARRRAVHARAGEEQVCFALWNLACRRRNQVALARAGAVAPLVALLSKGAPACRRRRRAR